MNTQQSTKAWRLTLQLVAQLVCAAYLLLFLLSDLNSPVIFTLKSLGLPIVILLFLLLLGFAILNSSNKWLLSSGLIMKGLCVWLLATQFSWQTDSVDDEKRFSITTFSSMTRTRNGSDVESYLEREKPEILCLQETTQEDSRHLAQFYDHVYRPDNENLVLASIWPISEVSTRLGIQVADISSDFGQIRMINVHLPLQYRHRDLGGPWGELLHLAGDGRDKTVLCGDFNMTPFNSAYRLVTRRLGYKDAHDKGLGFGLTFPFKQRSIAIFGPLIRIDYIFLRGLEIESSRTLPISRLSDHKAVSGIVRVVGP